MMNYFGGQNWGNSSGWGWQNSCCPSFSPCCSCGNYSGGGNSSYYAIILVLFILLVIVIGSRFNN